MKKQKLTFIAGLSVLVLSTFIYAGCDINAAKDAFENFDVIIQLEPINTSIGGLIIDANTENFVTSDVHLRFAGDDAGSIIDMFSDPLTEATVSEGVTGFGIQNSVVPSETNPVKFRVIAEADGYEQGAATLTLTSTGTHSFQIRLIREDQAPQGAATVNSPDVQVDQSGTVTTTVTVQTPPTQTQSQTQVAVTVPAGTVMQDAAGNPLTGQINTEVTYFSVEEEQTFKALPGGSGQLTGGFFKLKVTDSNGRKARSFSNDIDIDITSAGGGVGLAKGLGTMREVTFTILKWDVANGEWVDFQTDITCDPLIADNMNADYCTTSWTTSVAGIFGLSLAQSSITNCIPNITINRNGNNGSLNVVFSSAADFTVNTVPSFGSRVEKEFAATSTNATFSEELINFSSTFGSGSGVTYSHIITVTSAGTQLYFNGSIDNMCSAPNIDLQTPSGSSGYVKVKGRPDCGTQTCTLFGEITATTGVLKPLRFKRTSNQIAGVTMFFKKYGQTDAYASILPYTLITESEVPGAYCKGSPGTRVFQIEVLLSGVQQSENYTAFAIANNGVWRLGEVTGQSYVTISETPATDAASAPTQNVTINLNADQRGEYCAQ